VQKVPVGGREDAAERLNDSALKDKVESEIFREPDAPKDKVSVNVEDGVVYLRGQLDDRQAIERLADAAAKVEGVRSVESLLHTPDQPAPTWASTGTASDRPPGNRRAVGAAAPASGCRVARG
jgi:hypothetical protein